MNALLIGFLDLYFIIEMFHKYYVELDVDKHSDNMSPERRAWHNLAFWQAALMVAFLCVCIYFKIQFTISILLVIPIAMLTRWVLMDNGKNVLKGGLSNILYVEKENTINGKLHWFANKTGIPVEIVGLIPKLILTVLIIILWLGIISLD